MGTQHLLARCIVTHRPCPLPATPACLTCLQALVEEEMAALVEAEGGGNEEGAPTASRGGTGGSQAPNGAVSGGSGSGQEGSQGGSQGLAPGELLAREAAEVPLNDAQRREAEVLRAAGITGGRVEVKAVGWLSGALHAHRLGLRAGLLHSTQSFAGLPLARWYCTAPSGHSRSIQPTAPQAPCCTRWPSLAQRTSRRRRLWSELASSECCSGCHDVHACFLLLPLLPMMPLLPLLDIWSLPCCGLHGSANCQTRATHPTCPCRPLPPHRRSQAAAAQAAAAATNAAKRPRQLQSARQAKYAATAAVGAGSGLVQQQELPLLESLAQLMGLSVQEATSVLLNMTPAQRAELRRGFAAQDDPSVGPSGGSKGSKQGSGGPGGSRGAGTVAAEEAAAEAADGLETDGGSEGRGMDPDDGLDPEFAAPD